MVTHVKRQQALAFCAKGITTREIVVGFPEAIVVVFSKTQVQLCIVHLVSNSLRFAFWKDRKAIAQGLRKSIGRLS